MVALLRKERKVAGKKKKERKKKRGNFEKNNKVKARRVREGFSMCTNT